MLVAGTRLGAFEISAAIGAGGMGEVYRARDTRLNRDVAIKILPDALTGDAQHLARFEREARVLASLNHPHIAQIYGVEESSGVRALVMEFVDGDDLAHRLTQRPLRPEEAIRIALQVAHALEAAHEQGIIHRDLKPANVKVRADGTVKVLDFGLAKALERGESPGPSVENSPTITNAAHLTMQGVILGTAAYMAPEQARGHVVDKRADIWAFGALLYEMLSGRRAFAGSTVSDIVAAILKTEPDWAVLPSDTPLLVHRLLRRCLQKDHRQRLGDIRDARIDLEDAIANPAAPSRSRLGAMSIALTMAALIAGAIGGFVGGRWNTDRGAEVVRFSITTAADQLAAGESLAVSPDGRTVVYSALRDGVRQLFRRPLDAMEATPIPGTGGANSPFFSPSGESLGFFQQGSLKHVSLETGAVLTICGVNGAFAGASWSRDGMVAFSSNYALWHVSATGGAPQRLDSDSGQVRWPRYWDDNRAILFTVWTGSLDTSHIAVRTSSGAIKQVIDGTYAWPVSREHIVFARSGGSLWVARLTPQFDVVGAPTRILDDVFVNSSGSAPIAISPQGTLVYSASGGMTSSRSLVWVDRQGRAEPIAAPPKPYYIPRLSPDGSEIAVDVTEGENRDIWIFDLRTSVIRRFTSDPALDSYPVWSWDGRHIVFASNRAGGPRNLFWKPISGQGREERQGNLCSPFPRASGRGSSDCRRRGIVAGMVQVGA